MCGMMNVIQWRSGQACTRAEWDAYLKICADSAREDFYFAPTVEIEETDGVLVWDSPIRSGFAENDRTRVHIFRGTNSPAAPTVIILHALMSASDVGYRRIAAEFNRRGWNVVFPHLPFHYSRTPKGFFNGELAVTANLVRIGETLRQCVVELRQVMAWLRQQGVTEFGLLGTSYGGWNAALLSFVEKDFRFVGLIQPIVDLESAIWLNPGAAALRRLLQRNEIQRGETSKVSHLSSPRHGIPLCGADRIVITAGTFDTVAPMADLIALHETWAGSKLLRVSQGHFGYDAMRETLKAIDPLL